MTGICLFIPVVMACWMFWMPDSPVYLVSRGRLSEAKAALTFLRGPQFDAEQEVASIQQSVAASRAAGSVGFVTLFTR